MMETNMQLNVEPTIAFSTDRDKPELIDLVKKISSYAKDAVDSSHDALQSAIAAGGCLVRAKERVLYGRWGLWLKENFKFSQSTANDWMRLYGYRKELLDLIKGEPKQYMSVADALKLVGAKPGRPELTKYQLVKKRCGDVIREIYNQSPSDERKTRELVIKLVNDLSVYLKSHGK
jgi:hypothetical protein